MAQSLRHRQLFAAEDWRKIYRSFLSQVNFVSYDFDTLRQSFVEYIRANYPEEFNDFIESSEFIMLVDLIAWLGQALAFRVDLNARENFLDTAERRESILRLARLLSYKPRRNIAAKGFLKVVGIRTDHDVYDSNGLNLNGIRVNWNDRNNPDWYEQFITILNEAFNTSNPFGSPVQKGIDATNVNVGVYQIRQGSNNPLVYPFQATVDGETLPFEVVNVSFTKEGLYVERNPDPEQSFHIIYKNDQRGFESSNTGFFLYFKQGTLQFQDFNIEIPIENRVLDINVDNINNDDVFVQSIRDDGTVERHWQKVPSVIDLNVIFNDFAVDVRDIFSVETRENDQISIRFGDGRFGSIAYGLLRVFFRVSYGDYLTIRPSDITNIPITIPYITKTGLERNLILYVSLTEVVQNSAPPETNDEIKRNAPQVFYTQNRIVTGEDYNSYFLGLPGIKKFKSINRTFAGHSRYIDITDPTGFHRSIKIVGDDGIFWFRKDNNLVSVDSFSTLPGRTIVTTYLMPEMEKYTFKNFLIDAVKNNAVLCSAFSDLFDFPPTGTAYGKIMWDSVLEIFNYSTGRFVADPPSIPVPPTVSALQVGAGIPAANSLDLIREGSYIKFKNSGWRAVVDLQDFGVGSTNGFNLDGSGKVRLSGRVEEGDEVEKVVPVRFKLTPTEIDEIGSRIALNSQFAVFYDFISDRWRIDEPLTPGGFDPNVDFDYCYDDTRWMILFMPDPIEDRLDIIIRGLEYIFESERDVRFYFLNQGFNFNPDTGEVERDHVIIFGSNLNAELANKDISPWRYNHEYSPGEYVVYENTVYKALTSSFTVSGLPFPTNEWLPVCPSIGKDLRISLEEHFYLEDGEIDPRRVKVSYYDSNNDGFVDDLDIFDTIVFGDVNPYSPQADAQTLVWILKENELYDEYVPVSAKIFVSDTLLSAINLMDSHFIDEITRPQWSDSEIAIAAVSGFSDFIVYDFKKNNVYQPGDILPPGFNYGYTKIPSHQPVIDSSLVQFGRGRKSLKFMWKHLSDTDAIIDPSVSNIIDVFVLTEDYDRQVREYLLNRDTVGVPPPTPPTPSLLNLQFQNVTKYKMISDQIIWIPVKYKILFGSRAPEELRARIKVVKTPGSRLSDEEIKSRIVNLVYEFFDPDLWDFGETFYFSELAAYIHQNLVLDIASVALVPLNEESSYGDLHEIRSMPDELFIPDITVNDIEIIKTLSKTSLRIR